MTMAIDSPEIEQAGHASLAIRGMLCDPGTHFQGRFEVERKYRVADLEALRSGILALGAVAFTIGNRETDVFFDTVDGRLAAKGQQQVLRLMQPSERVLWISKGPEPDRCVAMDLADFESALAMLQSVGFREVGRLTKNRDIYFLGDFHVTLDELPGLGTFAEFAVMTEDGESLESWGRRIEAAAIELGIRPTALIRTSYRDMVRENCES